MPWTTQRSPGTQFEVRMASNTVAPAQKSGASSAYEACSRASSGMDTRAAARAGGRRSVGQSKAR